MFKGSSKLGFWGAVATFIYFLAIAYLILFTDYVEPKSLTLNELGDFFAGVFGPPALIWVVISFYLQSEELKNSVNALKLQAEELAKSVEQQIAMVDLTRKSISHDETRLFLDEEKRKADLQPNFSITGNQSFSMGESSTSYDMNIQNMGAPVTEVTISLSPDIKPAGKLNYEKVWNRSDSGRIRVRFDCPSNENSKYTIGISYKDANGVLGEQSFNSDNSGNCTKITSP